MTKFLVLCIAVAAVVLSCSKAAVDRTPQDEETGAAGQTYDPLASKIDRQVVPEVYPIQITAVPEAGDSLLSPLPVSYDEYDSTSSQVSPTEVYRVQIFTSRLYAEANRERALADEIFNLPVHLDYEVPYYKLRVGDFTTRDEAEDMVSEIRAIGYRNAWVARVIQRIHEAPAFAPEDEPILPGDTTITPLIPVDSTDSVLMESGDEPR